MKIMTEKTLKNKKINEHKYLFLEQISESTNNTLRLVVSVAEISNEKGSVKIGNSFVDGVHSVTPSNICYEIFFESYIAYFVLNESYDTPYTGLENENWEGKNFRVTSESEFTRFLETSSISKDWLGHYIHYRIYCQNHVINVVSLKEPIIKPLIKSTLNN